jgi:hypothetical protein
MTSRYSGFFVDVEAQSGRCGVAPLETRKSQVSPEKSYL